MDLKSKTNYKNYKVTKFCFPIIFVLLYDHTVFFYLHTQDINVEDVQ